MLPGLGLPRQQVVGLVLASGNTLERTREGTDVMTRFDVGDRVLHPRYGPGTLVSIEELSDNGEADEYYVIQLTRRKGRLLTPVEKAKTVGLHAPGSKEDVDKLWKVLARQPKEMSSDYRKRRRQARHTFREGSLIDVGRVVRDLAWRKSEGQATIGDRRLLKRAKNLLAEELAALDAMDKNEATKRVESVLEEQLAA